MKLPSFAWTAAFAPLNNMVSAMCQAAYIMLQHTRRAMTNVGIPEDEQNAVFQLVATVLHLGNLEFEEAGEHDSSKLMESAADALQAAASLLGTSADGLARALTTRTRQTVDGNTIHSIIFARL